MLKIAKSVEYAVLSLKYISEQNQHCNAKEISEAMNIPYDLLAKILQKLSKQSIIQSVQGTKGGYYLNLPSSDISLKLIIESVEQDIQLTDCMVEHPSSEDCKRYNDCCLVNPMNKLQLKIIELFENTKLKEIIN